MIDESATTDPIHLNFTEGPIERNFTDHLKPYVAIMRKWIDLDAFAVLDLLEQNSGLTWDELCLKLGFDPHARHPGPMQLCNCLWMLAEADFVTADGIDASNLVEAIRTCVRPDGQPARFRVSKHWVKTKMILEARFMGGTREKGYSMNVKPTFGRPLNLPDQADIFVVMPFAKEYSDVYRDHITNVAQLLNLSVARADDLFTNNQIMTDVWSSIAGSGIIVADCTGRNPNVFYEIGVAHAIGKPVILITRSSEDVPSDLKHIKYIQYEFTPKGMKEFEETLGKTIKTSLGLYTSDW